MSDSQAAPIPAAAVWAAERHSFASLALELRRQWHTRRRWAAEAKAAGRTREAEQMANRAAQYLDDARWYLAKAQDRTPINPEN